MPDCCEREGLVGATLRGGEVGPLDGGDDGVDCGGANAGCAGCVAACEGWDVRVGVGGGDRGEAFVAEGEVLLGLGLRLWGL